MTTPFQPKGVEAEKPLRVRRGRVDSVDLYEIKDSELDFLEKGSPSDIQLNFAIFLLSLAFSGTCTLVTATFGNATVKLVVVVVTVVGIFLGGYFLLSWWKARSSMKDLCARIRSRIPPDVPPLIPSPNNPPTDDDTRPAG
jgi:hypothetical protein